MRFTRDARKNAANVRKHGIKFVFLTAKESSESTEGLPMTKNVGLRSQSPRTTKFTSPTSKKGRTSNDSSRLGLPRNGSVKSTGVRSAGKTDWERLRKMTDEDIRKAIADDPDAPPELDEEFWKKAIFVRVTKKLPMTVRLDADVLKWFRSHGKGYQTRINAVLRSYMQAHKR